MNAFLLLFLCFALGILVARFVKTPPGLVPGLNWWVINVALPSLVLDLIPKLHFNWQLWFLIVPMWCVFLGAWVVCAVFGHWFKWSRERLGALTLVAGLSNSAFTGYPMIEALRGKEGLALAVITDQLGCFLALAAGGITVAAWYSGGKPQPAAIAKRIATFPPFLALIVGTVAGVLGGGWPAPLTGVFERLGATLSPLALFSIGMQFTLQLSREQFGAVGFALAWKLLAAPALVFATGILFHVHGTVLAVAVLQAGMSPMISAAILADQYGLEPRVANATLGVGILVSLLTIPLLNQLA
jgi:malate permease and related proteins